CDAYVLLSLDRPLFLKVILSYLLQFFGLVFREYYRMMRQLMTAMTNPHRRLKRLLSLGRLP
ncbi:hypothetical protein, partial [Psychrobacter sanguinis]|uniref:hypothetical protein n=1 Tax=Psychrobacter sanguinis TaxID=861445 RepID=UPI0036323A09